MSKLIVDQIQKSGGPVLSLPPSTAPTPQAGDFLAVAADGQLTFAQPDFSPIDDAVASVDATIQTALAGLEPGVSFTNHKDLSADYMPSDLQINLPPSSQLMTGGTELRTNDGTADYCGGSGGASQNWTVPAGVTQAQWQVWGSGAPGTSRAECCFFGSNGGEGAYSFVKMEVNEGELYCICSGGACQSGACGSAFNCHGCNSYICSADSSTGIQSCGAPACDTCYVSYSNRLGSFYCLDGNTYYGFGGECSPTFQESFSRTDSGLISSSNTIFMESQIRARKGPFHGSTYNCCYHHIVSGAHIDCNHNVWRCWAGVRCEAEMNGGSGCCWYNIDRGPGRGGWGGFHNQQCCGYYGGYPNTGEVLLTYK